MFASHLTTSRSKHTGYPLSTFHVVVGGNILVCVRTFTLCTVKRWFSVTAIIIILWDQPCLCYLHVYKQAFVKFTIYGTRIRITPLKVHIAKLGFACKHYFNQTMSESNFNIMLPSQNNDIYKNSSYLLVSFCLKFDNVARILIILELVNQSKLLASI